VTDRWNNDENVTRINTLKITGAWVGRISKQNVKNIQKHTEHEEMQWKLGIYTTYRLL